MEVRGTRGEDEGEAPREAGRRHRSAIVLAVAVATYVVGRTGASLTLLVLFGLALAAVLYIHLAGRGDDRFAAFYAGVIGTGAALVAGLVGGWA